MIFIFKTINCGYYRIANHSRTFYPSGRNANSLNTINGFNGYSNKYNINHDWRSKLHSKREDGGGVYENKFSPKPEVHREFGSGCLNYGPKWRGALKYEQNKRNLFFNKKNGKLQNSDPDLEYKCRWLPNRGFKFFRTDNRMNNNEANNENNLTNNNDDHGKIMDANVNEDIKKLFEIYEKIKNSENDMDLIDELLSNKEKSENFDKLKEITKDLDFSKWMSEKGLGRKYDSLKNMAKNMNHKKMALKRRFKEAYDYLRNEAKNMNFSEFKDAYNNLKKMVNDLNFDELVPKAEFIKAYDNFREFGRSINHKRWLEDMGLTKEYDDLKKNSESMNFEKANDDLDEIQKLEGSDPKTELLKNGINSIKKENNLYDKEYFSKLSKLRDEGLISRRDFLDKWEDRLNNVYRQYDDIVGKNYDKIAENHKRIKAFLLGKQSFVRGLIDRPMKRFTDYSRNVLQNIREMNYLKELAPNYI